MNPFLLIGIDLVLSTVIVLLAAFIIWRRVRTCLELHMRGDVRPVRKKRTASRSTASAHRAYARQAQEVPYLDVQHPARVASPDVSSFTDLQSITPRGPRGKDNPVVSAWANSDSNKTASGVKKLHGQGLSAEQIAQRLGCSAGEVEMILACLEMEQRSASGNETRERFTSRRKMLQAM